MRRPFSPRNSINFSLFSLSFSFIAGDSDGRLAHAVHGARRQGVLQAGDGRRAGRVDGYQVQGEGRGAQRGDFVSGKREGGTAGYASDKLKEYRYSNWPITDFFGRIFGMATKSSFIG